MSQSKGKLVRDRIPEILEAADRVYRVQVLDGADYHRALRSKLLEEAGEAAAVAVSSSQLVEELADLLEVIQALVETSGLTMDQVVAAQEKKRDERGGFAARLFLQEVCKPST